MASEVCKRWPQRPYLACLPLKLDGFSRPSLKPVPASSSNASEYASSAQGSKEAYPSSTLSAGSHRGLSSHRSLAYSSCWDGFSFTKACFTILIHPSQFHFISTLTYSSSET